MSMIKQLDKELLFTFLLPNVKHLKVADHFWYAKI